MKLLYIEVNCIDKFLSSSSLQKSKLRQSIIYYAVNIYIYIYFVSVVNIYLMYITCLTFKFVCNYLMKHNNVSSIYCTIVYKIKKSVFFVWVKRVYVVLHSITINFVCIYYFFLWNITRYEITRSIIFSFYFRVNIYKLFSISIFIINV